MPNTWYCPYCGESTVLWEEYTTHYIRCPYCNQHTMRRERPPQSINGVIMTAKTSTSKLMRWIETKCRDCESINVFLTDAWQGAKICPGDFSRTHCTPCDRKTMHMVVKELHTIDEKVDAKIREYNCASGIGKTGDAKMISRLDTLRSEIRYMKDELAKRDLTAKPVPPEPKPKDEVGSRFSGLILE